MMSRISVTLIGWGLIASIVAVCFVLNMLRFQHLHFNLFIIFMLAASITLVVSIYYLEREVKNPDK